MGSAIRGGLVTPILPVNPGQPSPLEPQERDLDILFTAETHNFPCAVSAAAAALRRLKAETCNFPCYSLRLLLLMMMMNAHMPCLLPGAETDWPSEQSIIICCDGHCHQRLSNGQEYLHARTCTREKGALPDFCFTCLLASQPARQVAPFPGAETGAGGRIRDTHATGIGSLIGAATAGYCVGNLQVRDVRG